VTDHLKALEKKGYIRREPAISRGLQLLPEPTAATSEEPGR